MSRKRKIVERARNNPKDVRFTDACKIAGWFKFKQRESSGSSHVSFSRPDVDRILVFQDNDGNLPPYQVKQLFDAIDENDLRMEDDDE